MRERNIPNIPAHAVPVRDKAWDVYDVGLRRWRCHPGTKKVVTFIQYSYDPQEHPDRKDIPWTRDNIWSASDAP